MRSLSTHYVISLCFFPWPLPVCFKTTIMTFPQESHFNSAHIIKVLKNPSPLPLFPYSHLTACGSATYGAHCWFTALTEQIYLAGWSLLLLGAPHSALKPWEVMKPYPWCLIGRYTSRRHHTFLHRIIRKGQRASSHAGDNKTVITFSVSASFCAPSGVHYKLLKRMTNLLHCPII